MVLQNVTGRPTVNFVCMLMPPVVYSYSLSDTNTVKFIGGGGGGGDAKNDI